MACDPSQGTLEFGGTFYSAALLYECGTPSATGDNVEATFSAGFCTGVLTASLNLTAANIGTLPTPSSTCAAGYQCVPTNATDASCSTGACIPCNFGQYCPSSTSNRCGALTHNICPAGYSCASPSTLESCAAGYYCPSGTYDGGYQCAKIGGGNPNLHSTTSYGYTLYCGHGSNSPSTCSAGYLCHNSSYRELCPAGYKCPEGANETQRCLTDGFGAISPESRCPAGSNSEGSKYDLVVLPLILWALLWAGAMLTVRLIKVRNLGLWRAPVAADKEVGTARWADAQRSMMAVVAGALEKERSANKRRQGTDGRKFHRDAKQRRGPLRSLNRVGTSENLPKPETTNGLEAGVLTPSSAQTKLQLCFKRYLAKRKRQTGEGENFLSLRLKNVSFAIGPNRILSGLNVDMKQGELCALMGESGSGKTTLLNAISGRATYGTLSGDVMLNNRRLSASVSMGFVPQSYLVQKVLTVHENLWYSSVLRLPGLNKEERNALIHSVLKLLGLSACAHFSCDRDNSKVKLSGGQLRRVGIGSELVTRPSILLLDEPTSALDAVNTRLVVDVLRNLCTQHGILVIASLHQPRFSVYAALDKVLVLSRGEFIYAGAQKQALGYLSPLGYVPESGENPADFFIEIAFGFVKSTADPPVPQKELPSLWNRKIAADREAESAARMTGTCTWDEFVTWFLGCRMPVGYVSREALWSQAELASSSTRQNITWELLHSLMDSWEILSKPRQGLFAQFRCCLARYCLALWRKRSKNVGVLVIM